MKTKLIRAIAMLVLMGMLALCMTGCQDLDYRKAVDLYNRGRFDAAAEMFYELGDYRDSADLFTLSHYWAAVSRMEAGKYSEALPRFIKLGNYEDSEARAVECKYQLAIVAYEGGNFNDARNYFQDIADYKQSGEYLRRLNWQKLHDCIREVGSEAGGCYVLSYQQDSHTVNVLVESSQPDQIFFTVSREKATLSHSLDELKLSLPRNSISATYTAHSYFAFEMNGSTIGSSQTADGKLDITTCTPETVLVLDTFELTGTDNHGNALSSTDPADCLMQDTMQENLAKILTSVPQLLEEAGIVVTLQDIGFHSLS